jgi:hypothetical protein
LAEAVLASLQRLQQDVLLLLRGGGLRELVHYIHQPVLYLLHQGVAVLAHNGLDGDVVVAGVFRVWEDVGEGGVAQGVDDVGPLGISHLTRQLLVVVGDAEVRHGECVQVAEEVVVLLGLLLKLGR